MNIFKIMSSSQETSVDIKKSDLAIDMPNKKKEQNDDELNLNFVYKTKMDLVVNAPLIIIPQNSKSKNAVIIDCGEIRTETSLLIQHEYFESTELKHNHKIPPIIEKQTIKLVDVKILR